jgi:hypothetical protein
VDVYDAINKMNLPVNEAEEHNSQIIRCAVLHRIRKKLLLPSLNKEYQWIGSSAG